VSEYIASATGNICGYPSDIPALTPQQRLLAQHPKANWLAMCIMQEHEQEGYWRAAKVCSGCYLDTVKLYDDLLAAGVMRTVQPGKGLPYQKANHITRPWCLTARAIFDEQQSNNKPIGQKE
jgi:hypothetical protein